jgi:SAM-dependent methyltransferase
MPLLKEKLEDKDWFKSDTQFDQLYSIPTQQLAHRHWTPLDVAKKAADFLATDRNAKILDIGSGVGKFCLSAAHFKPNAFFLGIEQRKSLINQAEEVKVKLGLDNVTFIQGNFTQIDFKNYDHFYFYNSFYENLYGTPKIDNSLEYSRELYNYYNFYLYKQLEKKPVGTKLVTFHSLDEEMPNGYHIVGADLDDLLKYWEKID